MPARIIQSSSGAALDAVPPFSYSTGCDSYVLALQSAAASLDRSISYPMLKGLSALAFRLLLHPDWHRYSPDALVGFNHTPLAFGCLGLRAVTSQVNPQDSLSVQHSRMEIVNSIRAGQPVLGLHLIDWEDWGVIAGYRFGGDILCCRTPHDHDTNHLVDNKNWPVMVIHVYEQEGLTDHKTSILHSLRAAVELFNSEQYGIYYSGRDAFLYWIAGLRNHAVFDLLEERRDRDYAHWINLLRAADEVNASHDRRYSSPYLERAHVNAWRLTSLTDARRSAAQYLQEVAALFSPAAAQHLCNAANHYAQIAGLLESARPLAPWEFQLIQTPWTREMRLQQSEILEQVLGMEGQAVRSIEQALE